ncbi:uncharacterized protein Tco025E_05041 [Trypanosoma conorhini]|uniref:Uncharacterized protein n=1 Tax=Trypanosoma conorhini TaxID=83891 RepID=A0A3S5IT58_9TRYP|nr:uncharacterized protein Tco025E_05041 [Trypanosoma conorhini]RNF16811.1 hypothetical protein Tco025E_05041 [Trypanosoma conorhini]
MPNSRAPLRRRSEASSYLVRSPSAATSVDNTNSCASGAYYSKRRPRLADAPALDVLSLGLREDGAAAAAASTPVTSAGVFVTPNPILATLSTSEWLMSSRAHSADPAPRSPSGKPPLLGVVVTAEVGGWLRVRDQRNGTIHYQRRLRSRSNPLCLCWSFAACCSFFVGQQCGLVTMLQLQYESMIEVADCVLHEAAIVAMARVFVPAREGADAEVAAERNSGTARELLLTLDANGVLAVWKTAGPHCLQKLQLPHPPFRSLTSDERLPGGVFVPGGVEGALSADDGGGRAGVFDVALLECPQEVGVAWRTRMTYGGARAAVISMALAPRHGSAATTLTLWGGTEGGALHMWDVDSGAPLRVVEEATPSCAPVHYLHCASCLDPRHVWVCTRGGSVTLWDTDRLRMLAELPVSYPRGPAVGGQPSTPLRPNCGACERDADADACFLPHLVPDASEAPAHFTLFMRPIEPVLTLRLWSAATDGAVRSWLCQTNLSEFSLREAAPASATDGVPSFIAGETVRAFIVGKARGLAEEAAALRRDVARRTREAAALQARNRVLADALKTATARIASHRAGDDVADAKPPVESPPPPPPPPPPRQLPPSPLGESPHVKSMRITLEELRRRLQDAFAENERLSADKMALRLRLAEQLPRLESAQEAPAAVLLPVAVAEEEPAAVKRLQEELAACQATCKKYMLHWRKEQTRREAAEEECEACKRRLRTLEGERRRAQTLLSRPPTDAAARAQGNARQPAQDEGVDGDSSLEKLAFCCGTLSGRRDAAIEEAARHDWGSTWSELIRREQRLAAAQEATEETWGEVQRARAGAEAEAAEVRRTRQRLTEREAKLLDHAERLCALEEELRRRERRMFQRRSRSR